MTLATGTRLGVYEVTGQLGAGGMGQVYRARDTRLNRDVALKVLPDAFANDADRLTRFTREAQTLAALNHPNVAQIYGIEQNALVMELVEGEDLSQLISPGAKAPGLQLQDILSIARQIAEALEAAHEQGIIHRDLKPANVKVRRDGTVKVLDFGLAKALGPNPGSGTQDAGPTVTSDPTERGVVLGTAAYMPPEQARGKPVDKRADIWAFGVVLYEMLTGTRAFGGDTFSDVLAAVLRHEIDWSRLPASTSPGVRQLLARCLEPDPKLRLRDIGEARVALAPERRDDSSPVAVIAPSARPRPMLRREQAAWGLALVALLAAAVLGVQRMTAGDATPASNRGEVTRLSVLPPPGLSINPDSPNTAISPNGRMVAFIVGTGPSVENQLWVRQLNSPVARRIEGGDGAAQPFWSPDSDRIGFFSRGQLKTVAAAGGPSQVVCSAPFGRGAAWSRSNVIVFAPEATGPLHRVPAGGGESTPVTAIDAGLKETSHRFPVFLPDGDHFLYAAMPGADGVYEMFAGSLRDNQLKRSIGRMESSPAYVDRGIAPGSEFGWLLFTRQGTLSAQQFDAPNLRLVGDVVTLGDQPSVALRAAAYDAGRRVSASSTGSLAYVLGASGDTRVNWMDLSGRIIGTVGVPPAQYSAVSISPNGSSAALVRADSQTSSSLWLVELNRASALPLWSGPGVSPSPTWSPDSTRVAFSSIRGDRNGIFEKAVSNAGNERTILLTDDAALVPSDWSSEYGIVFSRIDKGGRWNVYRVADSGSTEPVPIVNGPAIELGGYVSPDGRWLAYLSDEAGSADLYVRGLKGDGQKAQVATGGVANITWAPGGRAIFYTKRDQTLWRVGVDLSATPPRISTPEQLGALPSSLIAMDLAPDGKRLLALVPEQAGLNALMIVQSWPSALPAILNRR